MTATTHSDFVTRLMSIRKELNSVYMDLDDIKGEHADLERAFVQIDEALSLVDDVVEERE